MMLDTRKLSCEQCGIGLLKSHNYQLAEIEFELRTV